MELSLYYNLNNNKMEGRTKNKIKLIKSAQKRFNFTLKTIPLNIEDFLMIYSSPTAEQTIKAQNNEEKTKKISLISNVLTILEQDFYLGKISRNLTKQEVQTFTKFLEGVMTNYLQKITTFKDYAEIFQAVKLGFSILNEIQELSKETVINVFNNENTNQGILLYLNQNMIQKKTLNCIKYILNTYLCKMDPLSKGPHQGHYFYKITAAITRFCRQRNSKESLKIYFLSIVLKICAYASTDIMKIILHSHLSGEIVELIFRFPNTIIVEDFAFFLSVVEDSLPSTFLKAFLEELFLDQKNFIFLLKIANNQPLCQNENHLKEIVTIFLLQYKYRVRNRIEKKYYKYITEEIEEFLDQILDGYPVKRKRIVSDHFIQQKKEKSEKLPQITEQQIFFAKQLELSARKYFQQKRKEKKLIELIKPQVVKQDTSKIISASEKKPLQCQEKAVDNKLCKERQILQAEKITDDNLLKNTPQQEQSEEFVVIKNTEKATKGENKSLSATNESPKDASKSISIIVINQEQNPEAHEQSKQGEQISNMDEVRQIIKRKLKEKKQKKKHDAQKQEKKKHEIEKEQEKKRHDAQQKEEKKSKQLIVIDDD